MPAHGLMFHHFHGDRCGRHVPGQGTIDAAEFERLLRAVGLGRILPATEFVERAVAGSLDDDHCCITFDDNLGCQYTIAAPVLHDLGLTAFFFVYTSVHDGAFEMTEVYRKFRTLCFKDVDEFYEAFERDLLESSYAEDAHRVCLEKKNEIDAYLTQYSFYTPADRRFRYFRDQLLGAERFNKLMNAMMERRAIDLPDFASGLWITEEQLRELKREGHVIGMHSHSHPTQLSRESLERQRWEYEENHRRLAQIIGEPPICISHPCDCYTREGLGVLEELGVRFGFLAHMTDVVAGPYEYPRLDHALLQRRHMGSAG